MPSSLGIKAIIPRHIPKTAEYMKAVEKGLNTTGKLVDRDLASTTRTWKHKVYFAVTVVQNGDEMSIVAGTDDKIYGWVNNGTKPHIIRPRRSKFLRFAVGGSPKTRPGIIGSGPGAQGTDWRSALVILHPGTTPRKFTINIARRREKSLGQNISHNIAAVARTQA